MKKFIVAILSALILALMVAAFSACEWLNPKKEQNGPNAFQYEAGPDYIKITEIGGQQFASQWDSPEYKLDDGEWQSEAEFTSLAPNTEYTVSVRFSENDRFKASDAYSEKITTLKYEQDMPEVSLIQENKTIRFEENTALEFSYDGGNTYTSGNEYTYTENGKYTVKVRYKETEQKYSSAEQIFTVNISDFYSGSGAVDDPYLISTVDQFLKIDGGYYTLLNDLDFSGTVLSTPVRCKIFDGNGKKLKNVTLSATSADIAIFDYTCEKINDLTVENAVVDFTGEQSERYKVYKVSLLAVGSWEVINCHLSGMINIRDDYYNQYYIGGIIAYGLVDISNCSVDIKITTNTNSWLYVGGIVGYGVSGNYKMYNSWANVDFSFTGVYAGYVGGIVGYMNGGSVENCRADGEIIVNGDNDYGANSMYVGGIAGGLMNCKNCISTAAISANGLNQNVKVGGIIGKAWGNRTIENCLSAGMLVVSMGSTTDCVCDSIAGEPEESTIFDSCYHMEDVALGAATEHSIAVTAEIAKTLAWQKDVLGLDESIWNLTDGEYPSLK